MSRKNRSPEENARRAKIRELLQMANIDSMDNIQNLFKETIAEFMENGLEAELDEDLGYSKYDYKNKVTDNSRNGHSSKNLRTSFGEVKVSVPRDRKGEFEPQLLKKNQTSISQDIEEKILSMYAKGMATGDIEAHIQDIYGLSVSDTTVSRITDKILPVAKEWQQRPLESIYAVVFLDAIQKMYEYDLGVFNDDRAHHRYDVEIPSADDSENRNDYADFVRATTVTDTYHETKTRFAWVKSKTSVCKPD